MGSQSILIPRGTQAPNHKNHLEQSRSFFVKPKPVAEYVHPTQLFEENKDFESNQSVESHGLTQIAKPPSVNVFCASQSKSLLNAPYY